MVVVGLDIGTKNIRVVVAESKEDSKTEVLAVAAVPSSGIANGVIVSIESAMNSIKKAIDEAEQNCGIEISECIVSIGGDQIEGFNSSGLYIVSHTGSPKEISKEDVRKAIEVAISIKTPLDKEKLHVIPQMYAVDEVAGIKDPVTRLGIRLESNVHIITTSRTIIQNLRSCVERAGYEICGVMLKTLASTYAVVHQDELDLGSIIIDLGEGSTDVLVVLNGAPIFTGSIPLCGYHVTRDIQMIRDISLDEAEKIKIEYGCCWPDIADTSQSILIPGVGGRAPEEISQRELCEDINPRMTEIFEHVLDLIRQNTNVNKLSGNIILTGGGAKMEGVVELCQEVFSTGYVRVGIPENLGGNSSEYRSPEWATAIGLVLSNNTMVSKKDGAKGRKNFPFSKSVKNSSSKKESKLKNTKKMFF